CRQPESATGFVARLRAINPQSRPREQSHARGEWGSVEPRPLRSFLASVSRRQRFWLYRISVAGEQGIWQVPTPGQLLRATVARQSQQTLQIGRIIHVHRNSRQLQNDARLSRRLGGGMMGLETIITKKKRKQICRTAKGSVGSAPVA